MAADACHGVREQGADSRNGGRLAGPRGAGRSEGTLPVKNFSLEIVTMATMEGFTGTKEPRSGSVFSKRGQRPGDAAQAMADGPNIPMAPSQPEAVLIVR